MVGITLKSISVITLLLPISFFVGASSVSAVEVEFTPSTTNFQALVNGAAEGTTFRFRPGVYRNFSIQPKKGDTFQGEPGAILNGSTLLTFTREKPGRWVADAASIPPEATIGPMCDPKLRNGDGTPYTIGCSHSSSLYRNDVPLWRVATLEEVRSGNWFWDSAAKRIYISDDPRDSVIEIGTTNFAIHGSVPDVTIASLTIEKYAGPLQQAPVDCSNAGGWTVRDNIIRLNHSRGIGFVFCDSIKILGNKITSNGNLGVGCSATKNALVEHNEIDHNNYANVFAGWEAGGLKCTRTTSLIVRGNNVHDNLGAGLWSDIDAVFTIYDGNTVANNRDAGIFYEISHGAWIVRNTLSGNGKTEKGKDSWYWLSQILVATSDNVVVEFNTVTVGDSGNGITIVDQERGNDELGRIAARDNLVVRNTITYETTGGRTGAVSDRDNVFNNNNIFLDNVSLGVNPESHNSWMSGPWPAGFIGR